MSKSKNKKIEELKQRQANVKEVLMCSNATPILRQGHIGYMCCYCDLQYPDPAELKKHNLDIHEGLYNPTPWYLQNRLDDYYVKMDITDLKCKLCDADVESVEKLFVHLKDEHKKPIFTEIKNQILPFKLDKDTIKCCICQSSFDKFKSLLEHMHSHYRNFICEVCDLGFVTQGHLKRHAESHKLGEFKCRFCTKTYDTYRKKKSHEKIVHIYKNKINKCGFCDERFDSHKKRDLHIAEVHGVKSNPYKCSACDKTFMYKRALTAHTKRDHLMERKHKCSHCEMAYFTSSALKEHEVKHLEVRSRIKCDICSKTYASKKTLRDHMRIHNNDRRFNCEHCGQAFVQRNSLSSHMKHCHEEIEDLSK